MLFALLLFAGLWAGLQNALAGGGSFITLPALILSGMSPLAANITSTVALFPAQVSSGLSGRSLVSGAGKLSFRALFIISIAAPKSQLALRISSRMVLRTTVSPGPHAGPDQSGRLLPRSVASVSSTAQPARRAAA